MVGLPGPRTLKKDPIKLKPGPLRKDAPQLVLIPHWLEKGLYRAVLKLVHLGIQQNLYWEYQKIENRS